MQEKLEKWIFYVKNHSNLSDFFQLRIIDELIFWSTLFSKIMPNFWRTVTN